MSIFDRFSSKKGKDEKSVPKPKKIDASEKKAFAAVPSGKEKEVAKKEGDTQAATPKKTDAKKAAPATKEAMNGPANHVIVRPIVTEKSSRLNSLRQYVFEVKTNATKVDVRNAVHQLYGVRPINVSIINVRGNVVRYGRTWGKTNSRRKAMVTLPEGKSIDPFSA